MGTKGFMDSNTLASERVCSDDVAVCLLPGTEIAFSQPIEYAVANWSSDYQNTGCSVARFRQINTGNAMTHHDAIELPDGQQILLTCLKEGSEATVLQLPATPKNEVEAKEQTRLEIVR